MRITLLRDLEASQGLNRGAIIEVYEGAGSENGTRDEEGNPNGTLWIEAPRCPPDESRFRLIKPEDYKKHS